MLSDGYTILNKINKCLRARFALPPITFSGVDQAPNQRLFFLGSLVFFLLSGHASRWSMLKLSWCTLIVRWQPLVIVSLSHPGRTNNKTGRGGSMLLSPLPCVSIEERAPQMLHTLSTHFRRLLVNVYRPFPGNPSTVAHPDLPCI